MRRKHLLLLTTAASLLGALLMALLGAALVVHAGWYSVAATEQHWQPTFSLLETAMRQSVQRRAREIAVPQGLGEPAFILRGAACFRDKCVQCHGAPGVAHGDIGKSMQPLPGPLVDARQRWQAAELYWLTRHGIRMSGMPAWQHRLTEEEIWSIVAFLQQLPDLSAPQYAQVLAKADPAPACGRVLQADPQRLLPAQAQRGRQALQQYACNACHRIPGVTGADVHVGPPLQGLAGRALIAGTLPNTNANLIRWLRETQQVKPGTAMPQLDVSAQDAADIAAYLLSLD